MLGWDQRKWAPRSRIAISVGDQCLATGCRARPRLAAARPRCHVLVRCLAQIYCCRSHSKSRSYPIVLLGKNLSSIMVGSMAFSTSWSPSPLRHCRCSPLLLLAAAWLFLSLFSLPFFKRARPATRPPSSWILASSCVATESIWSNEGRDSAAFWSCSTCSRNERFSASRREQSFSRQRRRIDCCELVFASSRFCRRKRRLRTSVLSGAGWGRERRLVEARHVRRGSYVGMNDGRVDVRSQVRTCRERSRGRRCVRHERHRARWASRRCLP